MHEEILKKFENQEFANKIMRMKTKEEVKKALSGEGITPTDEEINELGNLINEIIKKVETLPEDELESIAGGGGGWGHAFRKILPTLVAGGVQLGAAFFGNQQAQTQAGATVVTAQADIAKAHAQSKMVDSLAVPFMILAVAGVVYLFKNDIKEFWYASSAKK